MWKNLLFSFCKEIFISTPALAIKEQIGKYFLANWNVFYPQTLQTRTVLGGFLEEILNTLLIGLRKRTPAGELSFITESTVWAAQMAT